MATASDDRTLLGRLVHRHRVRAGLTQRQLADLSTVSVRTIRDLEQGRARHPRRETVHLIAEGLRLGEGERDELRLAAGVEGGIGTPGTPGTSTSLNSPPPVPVDDMIGRSRDLTSLVGLLSSGAGRLVSVVGAPGVGKTRLALEVCARMADAGRTVLWNQASGPGLLPALRPDLVSLGVDELFAPPSDGGPPDPNGALDRLITLIGDTPTLLVLDGWRDGKPHPWRMLLLLRECPSLSVLTTAARPHRLPGERVYPLAPLDLPGQGRGHHGDGEPSSVRLFLDSTDPWFAPSPEDEEVISELCLLLDGIPRSLKLAAPWLGFHSPRALLDGLRKDPHGLLDEHQSESPCPSSQSFAACVAELSPEERTVLSLLCESPSGMSVDHLAERSGQPAIECGRLVRHLLVTGLVRTDGHARFRALHLVRTLERVRSAV